MNNPEMIAMARILAFKGRIRQLFVVPLADTTPVIFRPITKSRLLAARTARIVQSCIGLSADNYS
ncbi:MAG: hypothetical protein JST85_07555 [Acidobacteria bacterium]|nr:hypothetical protein [Acidobacteriota bacterium]